MKKELKQKNNKTKEDVKLLKTKIKEHPISIKRRLDFEKRRIKEEYRKKLAEKIRITKERLTRKQNKRYDKQQRKINYEIKQAPYKKQDVLYWQFILPQDEEKHDEMINDKIIEVRNKYPIITYGEKIKLEKRVNDISSMFFNDIKSITDINKHLESIYDAQNYAFKINVSYGYVFEEALNMEDYVYWLGHGCDDKRLLDEPMLIRNKKDFSKLINKLELVDEEEFAVKTSEGGKNSRVKALGIYQLFVKIYTLYDPIGAEVELPKILSNSKNIYTAFNNVTHADDKMCFWRCLAKHYNKDVRPINLVKIAKDLFYKYYDSDYIKEKKNTKCNHTSYLGIELYELEDIEIFFNINVNVYKIHVNKDEILAEKVHLHYDSSNKSDSITLGLYENHFIYIKDINKLCKVFRCEQCKKVFTRHDSLTKHQKSDCFELYKDMFVDTVEEFTHDDNIMKKILKYSKSKKSFVYPYFGVYDFESLADYVNKDKGKNTILLNKQVPISFSFGTNYETNIYHEVNNNTNELIKTLVQYFYKAQEEAYKKVMNEYFEYIRFYCLNKLKMIITDEKRHDNDLILFKDQKQIIFTLDKYNRNTIKDVMKIKKWLQFPILGFNNSFYDINVSKDYDFIKMFNPSSAIKQGSRYKSLSNDKICILDMMLYNPVGTSLDKYLKSRETDMIKGHFPYKWLTSYNKLYESKLPDYKFFESDKTTIEEYEKLKNIWTKEKIINMFDYLKYYNNLDVKPLIQAITKHRNFYYDLGFDMLKDAVSLSGLAEKIMFKNSSEQEYENVPYYEVPIYNSKGEYIKDKKVYDNKIYLINEDNKKCFYLLRENNVGGPSIVFHRYHEKDVTRISNVFRKNKKYILDSEGKIIKKIIGFDANALYLWSLSQYMPTSTLKYEEFSDNKNISDLMASTYGFYEVDIEVPDNDEMYNKFSAFPPIFKNSTLNDGSRKLISCMNAKKILLYYPLLEWYLKHGLQVTKVYGMIHCKKCQIFKSFGELVCNERRKGDRDEKYKIICDEIKNIGNSAYGRTSMNKAKHNKTTYETQHQYKKSVSTPYFRDADKYGEVYEVQKRKQTTYQNMPMQISTAILQYAKLKMLQFVYDFLYKYVSKDDFNICYMDTDSLYMSITSENFEDLIKPELKEEYVKDRSNWFPRNDTKEHTIYDNRTMGLFQTEFIGDGMCCLSSKLYYCLRNSNKSHEHYNKDDKFSSKGVQKKNNTSLLNYKNFKTVLHTHIPINCTNTGMRFMNGSIYYYSTNKTALSSKYNKRKIMSDGVSTCPLEENEYK